MRARPAVVAALLAVGSLAACEPPPPAPVLVVNSTAPDLHDADPGDGVCEVAPGSGTCTFGAALEEANALGRAEIHQAVSSPMPVVDIDVVVTGELVIRGVSGSPASPDGVQGLDLEVAPGARLTLQTWGILGGSVVVRGGLVADRATLLGNVDVRAGGVAIVVNTYVLELRGVPAVSNAGSLLLRQSTLESGYEEWMPPGETLHTAAGATTQLQGSWVTGSGTACGGAAPESLGFNADVDGSCGLGAAGDLSDLVDPYFHPQPGSPLIDAIPEGQAGCGTDLVGDLGGGVRPTDGDGDGTAACDIGAWEV
jgi:hypothetical protein